MLTPCKGYVIGRESFSKRALDACQPRNRIYEVMVSSRRRRSSNYFRWFARKTWTELASSSGIFLRSFRFMIEEEKKELIWAAENQLYARKWMFKGNERVERKLLLAKCMGSILFRFHLWELFQLIEIIKGNEIWWIVYAIIFLKNDINAFEWIIKFDELLINSALDFYSFLFVIKFFIFHSIQY